MIGENEIKDEDDDDDDEEKKQKWRCSIQIKSNRSYQQIRYIVERVLAVVSAGNEQRKKKSNQE